jgi:hypothetical protein
MIDSLDQTKNTGMEQIVYIHAGRQPAGNPLDDPLDERKIGFHKPVPVHGHIDITV